MGYKTPAPVFTKGKSGNMAGRPKVIPELAGVKRLSTDDLRRLITKCFNMPGNELKERACEPTTPALELAILSCLSKAIETGNYTNVTLLMDRVLGKCKESVEMDLKHDDVLHEVPRGEIVNYLRARLNKPPVIENDE